MYFKKISAVLVIAACMLAMCACAKSYTFVRVHEVQGTASLIRANDRGRKNVSLQMYSDMNLVDGDRLYVDDGSLVRLHMDQGSVYAHLESGTVAYLESTQVQKLAIVVEEGEMVTEVRKKLVGDESFTIRTPNTNMAIRGTVVAVRTESNADGGYDVYNYVLEGNVELEVPNAKNKSDGKVELKAGEGWKTASDKKGKITASEACDDSMFEYRDIDMDALMGAQSAPEPSKTSEKKKGNKENRFYELVSIDGYTREDFQNNPDLISDYNASNFAEYGTGIILDFDYDEGYVQYTWESITQNAYSSAPADNPSGTMDIQVFSFDPGSDVGQPEIWDTVNVDYADTTITVTYSGGCVEVYRLVSSESH
ncbi:MAG: FecR family protein [Lachnospiraceae bacterium]|nr:FecR family protein [Lachnospiraceae bacterium]